MLYQLTIRALGFAHPQLHLAITTGKDHYVQCLRVLEIELGLHACTLMTTVFPLPVLWTFMEMGWEFVQAAR